MSYYVTTISNGRNRSLFTHQSQTRRSGEGAVKWREVVVKLYTARRAPRSRDTAHPRHKEKDICDVHVIYGFMQYGPIYRTLYHYDSITAVC